MKKIIIAICIFLCTFSTVNAASYFLVNVHADGTRDNLDVCVTSMAQTEELIARGKEIKKSRSLPDGTIAFAENVWTGPIVKAEYGLVDVNGYQTITSADGGGLDTYINVNGNGYYDAAYIATKEINGVLKYQIKVSGKEGYINVNGEGNGASGKSDVVPLSMVKSPSYYEVKGGELLRRYSVNILKENSYYAPIPIGFAPKGLADGKYYSYDGNYFYTNLPALLEDVKERSNKRAVNKDNPYYNYYQYLSVRSRTNISPAEMNRFVDNVVGSAQSKMKGAGSLFVERGDAYTVNPAILFAIACNESAYGKSNIALTKNNLFGIRVYDTNTGSGTTYNSVRDCIDQMANMVISLGYCDTVGDSRFAGTFAGNKDSGINVKYASDPYWGEKIATHYYRLDKSTGFKDYGKYKIAIKKDYDPVNVRKTSNFEQAPVYKMQNRGRMLKNQAVIVDSESTGAFSNGSNKWYKIRSETILDKNKNTVNLFDANIYKNIFYNYADPFVYAHASFFRLVDAGKGCVHDIEKITTPATCEGKGIEKERCKKCGYEKVIKETNPLGHNFAKEEIVKNATCAADGVKKITCTRCNKTKEEKIPATGKHAYKEEVVNATCTQAKKIIKTCTTCGKKEEVVEGAPLGHSYGNWVVDKAATEFVDGLRHRICTRCNYKQEEVILSLGKYTEKPGEIYLESINYNTKTNKLDINGYLAIRGIYNKNKVYKIEFLNKKTKERTFKNLTAQTNGYPFAIPDLDGYNINESWFKDSVDITDLKQGDYEIYIIATQDKVMTRKILSNFFAKPIVKKAEVNGRGYTLDTNYYRRDVAVELVIRDQGLIGKINPPTRDSMHSYSRLCEFKDGKLRIRGCSFNVGVDYGPNVKVEREIVLENVDTFTRYTYNVGSIENGDYDVILNVPDGKSKKRVWFDASIDVANLPKGKYAIYSRTKTPNADDSARINDVFNPDLSKQKLTVNSKNYFLSINKSERYSLELEVK